MNYLGSGVVVPVQHQSLGPILEPIQGDVVFHERQHLGLVRDKDRRLDAALSRDRQANQTAAGPELQAVVVRDESASRRCCLSQWGSIF